VTASDRAAGHAQQEPRQNLGWNVGAALLLACSVTMLTDFSRRMLSANPDSLGIVSVSVQALFTVAASSTFTKAGWQWVESLLSRLKIGMHSQARWRFALSAALFVIVFPVWVWLPARLAVHYNDVGEKLESTDPAAALEDLQRSTALDPGLAAAQYNLGELLEQSYQYDLAASHYQQAIMANDQDVKSYNNLAHVLLLDGKAMTALNITDRALKIGTADPQALAALYENRGLAEFDLGFYAQAIADAQSSEKSQEGAAAYCLLGKIYGKTAAAADARSAWDKFSKVIDGSNAVSSMSAPDCMRLAEGVHEAN
jgi:tetratricopeptide (TPR) repeat protein